MSLFEPEFIAYLRAFFLSAAEGAGVDETAGAGMDAGGGGTGGSSGGMGAGTDSYTPGLLTFRSLLEWKDITAFLDEGSLDHTCLREVWLEALTARLGPREAVQMFPLGVSMGAAAGGAGGDKGMGAGVGAKGVGMGMGVGMGLAGVSQAAAQKALLLQSQPRFQLDFDTFVRLNFRLEEVLEEIREGLGGMSQEDVVSFYREQFQKLCKGKKLLTYRRLMDWDMMKSMIEEGEVTEEQVKQLWGALGRESVSNQSGRGFGQRQEEVGIDEEAFVTLNNALEDSISVLSNDN
ncbi:hypothetical protein B484DRAFT_454405 [Ochromonadaceae sp. CCMP2298]|nr:hypothetical protein B484DRAFT_454405 [Ochromonadaceae sp. CCMP2298]